MRATPPSRRMSAGTRSSAITATAPASSAMRACSASTTSMITPPLSISASPVLSRGVALSPSVAPVMRSPPMLAAGRRSGPARARDRPRSAAGPRASCDSGPSDDARCSIRLSLPPRLVAFRNSRTREATVSAPARPPVDLDREHAAERPHLAPRDRVPRVGREPGIVDAPRARMALDRRGQRERVRATGARTRTASVRSPRSTSQELKGEATAPSSVRSSRSRSSCRRARPKTSAPPCTSLWPPRYLVVECSTTSAPSASGCCSAGVAKVPSTSSCAPRACAISASRARSTTFISGFDGLSAQTRRVAGVSALLDRVEVGHRDRGRRQSPSAGRCRGR